MCIIERTRWRRTTKTLFPACYQLSKVYRSHSPTARKLSHLTDSSRSVISSMTLAFSPNFSSWGRLSGTCLTRLPTSLHAMARTCLSLSQLLERISASFLGRAPWSSSRIRRAFSLQKTGLRCGGDQRRWPDCTSAAYSSNVVCVFVYSSNISDSDFKSSRRSGSVK